MAVYAITEKTNGKIIAWATDGGHAEIMSVEDDRDTEVNYFPDYTEQDLNFKKLVNGELVVDQEELDVATAYEVRAERNLALKTVDDIAGNTLRWNSLTTEQQEEWAQYRLDLLNVPQQTGFPHNVNWPITPE